MDRLFLGFVAGSVMGGVALPLAWAIRDGAFYSFALGPSLGFGLVLFLPLTICFAPMWLLTHVFGLRGPVGAALAGVLSMLLPILLGIVLFERGPGFDVGPALVTALHLAPPGVLIGLTIWRVSHWRIEA
jgi:hypothetical protein